MYISAVFDHVLASTLDTLRIGDRWQILIHFRNSKRQRGFEWKVPFLGLGISELFCKSGIKRVVSMAKFGVEHESVKIFDLR